MCTGLLRLLLRTSRRSEPESSLNSGRFGVGERPLYLGWRDGREGCAAPGGWGNAELRGASGQEHGVTSPCSSFPAPAAGPAGCGAGQAGDHGGAEQHRWGESCCPAVGEGSFLLRGSDHSVQ